MPKTTVALPASVWLPIKSTRPYQLLVGLPTRIVPLRVRPLVTVKTALPARLPTSKSPLTVTPSKVRLPLPSSTAPLTVMIVPPRMTALNKGDRRLPLTISGAMVIVP